ncbi:FGGY-family carbohydrate kinase [Leminorella grimontii]
MLGLTLNHDKRHIIRATLEGICYRMRSVLESLEELTGKVEEIRVSGSFTHSPVWLQILADVIGREIHVPDVDEGAAYGAAIMGLYALGELSSIDKASDLIGIRKTYTPNGSHKHAYDRLYGIYLKTYWNLQEQFKDIADFQREKYHSM